MVLAVKGRIKAFIELARPFTMVAAMVAGVCIVLLYSAYYGMAFGWSTALSAGAILAMLQGAGQAMNQSVREEVEIDLVNGKGRRPTVDGRITLREGKFFAVLLALAAVAWAWSLDRGFGVGALLVAFFAVFYTLPPVQAKKRFVINNLWQGFSRGFLPWVAVWSLSGRWAILPFALGTVVALWVTGYQTTKDFGDVAGDRRYGVRTLPVVWGVEGSVRFMGWMAAAAFGVLAALVLTRIVPAGYALLLALAVPSAVILAKVRAPGTPRLLENGPAWMLMYMTLGLFYLLPVLIVRLH